MSNTLSEDDWDALIQQIRFDRCVPFLGAGASVGALPSARLLAQGWAGRFGFPLKQADNLSEVAQFLAVRYGPLYPKQLLVEEFDKAGEPDFAAPGEPHSVLAALPLSVYVTTNYDPFMVRALERSPFRKPVREFCRWNDVLRNYATVLPANYQAHPSTPVVFHLHGQTRLQADGGKPKALPESLVLTEDDYLRFLARMVSGQTLLPEAIRDALERGACLFIGYRLADWNFRLLFESLRGLKQRGVAVLLPPGSTDEEKAQAQDYLANYYKTILDVRVFWGTATEFCSELAKRWEAKHAKA
jgi:hypothetical protein